MWMILIPLLLLIIALVTVNTINTIQKRKRKNRLKLRRLRHEADNLDEIVNGLEQTIPNPAIIRSINDELIERLEEMLPLAGDNIAGVQASLDNATQKSEHLAEMSSNSEFSYRKANDVEIARSQYYLNEAAQTLKKRCSIGKLPEVELRIYLTELSWADLMIDVQSLVAQGYKAKLRGNLPGNFAYYQTAQNKLMESTHPNSKRMRMIRDMSELLAGNTERPGVDLIGEYFEAD